MESKAFASEWKALNFVSELSNKRVDNFVIYNNEVLDENYDPVIIFWHDKKIQFRISPGEIAYWLDFVPSDT